MTRPVSALLKKPLKVGGRVVENRLCLSPMAGLTHIAFRELVALHGGCGLLFTEMCNAKSVPHENRHVSTVFRWRDEELGQLVCQLFGSDPKCMARAARRVEKEGFFGVDINFGCSVAAIWKKNCGAALLKDPSHAVRIVAAVRKSVSIPLFVKFRTGWQDDVRPAPETAVELAKRFEDAGADALTFHPRLAPDRRSRSPRWDYIARVKEAVSIPVFGNGNVFDEHDCRKMLEETGCDGVALGRIAIAKPWLFSVLTEGMTPASDIYRKCALKIARLLSQHFDPVTAVKRFKKFAVYFSANFSFGHTLYHKLCRAETMAEIEENIDRLFDNCPAVTSKPNLSIFF